MVREHTEKVKPPRALFVPFPFGHALGRPNDPALQHRVLAAALALLGRRRPGPSCATFPTRPSRTTNRRRPRRPRRSRRPPEFPTTRRRRPGRCATITTQWLARNGGRTAFGLAGVPATRLVDVVRFLEAFAAGEDADMPERPPDLPLPGFIRYCADDLKAVYFEGRLAMKPTAGGDEIARWFWARDGGGPAPASRPRSAGRLRRPALRRPPPSASPADEEIDTCEFQRRRSASSSCPSCAPGACPTPTPTPPPR